MSINLYLLKEYVLHTLLQENYLPSQKLRIFDFDDTLVETDSMVYVDKPSGERIALTPGEFAIYEKQHGDTFDFSDFSKLINPRSIFWTGRILRNLARAGSQVVILTARSHADPVKKFLQDSGLPNYEVIALADANPLAKAGWIEKKIIENNIQYVEFFDDSPKNIAAVRELKYKYPNVKIIVRHIVPRGRGD